MVDRLNRPSGIPEIDATAKYELNLAAQLSRLYSLALEPEDLYVPGTNDGTFRSFSLRNSPQAGPIITEALRLAADPNQSTTFCTHADQGHLAFPDAVVWLSSSIANQGGGIACLDQLDLKRTLPTHRLRLTTAGYQEDIFPRPPTVSYVLQTINPPANAANSEKAKRLIIGRQLRVLAREKGIGFALIAANHMCIPVAEIESIFSRSSQDLGYKPKKAEHRRLLFKLHQTLTSDSKTEIFASLLGNDYRRAVKLLIEYGMVNGQQIAELETFQLQPLKFKPVAVFFGMVEKAYETADAQYRDPRKTAYITDNYSHLYTTQLVTAYLEFHPHSQIVRWSSGNNR